MAHINSSWIILVMFVSFWKVHVHGQTNNNFIVTDFGAVADGKTDSRKAFMDAWKQACESVGGMVSVPKGTFFVSGGDFNGPCNGPTSFRLDGYLIASDDPTIGHEYWITFYRVNVLRVFGKGIFDGNGANSWSKCHGLEKCNPLPPTTLKLQNVANASVEGIRLINSKMFHLNIDGSQNIALANLIITAPADSPNTDGIHIAESTAVNIRNTVISTGDDCVSMGGGTTNVNITGVQCGPGHGISIGSLGRYKSEGPVRGINVRNCIFKGTSNGLRIKTWAPSKCTTVVSDVTFAGIQITDVQNPIIIDQYYCPHGGCSRKGESSVQIKRVKFLKVWGSSATETAVSLRCSGIRPCRGITFAGLNMTYNGGPAKAVCMNVGEKFKGANQVPAKCL